MPINTPHQADFGITGAASLAPRRPESIVTFTGVGNFTPEIIFGSAFSPGGASIAFTDHRCSAIPPQS
jgi:hypothetical protein